MLYGLGLRGPIGLCKLGESRLDSNVATRSPTRLPVGGTGRKIRSGVAGRESPRMMGTGGRLWAEEPGERGEESPSECVRGEIGCPYNERLRTSALLAAAFDKKDVGRESSVEKIPPPALFPDPPDNADCSVRSEITLRTRRSLSKFKGSVTYELEPT